MTLSNNVYTHALQLFKVLKLNFSTMNNGAHSQNAAISSVDLHHTSAADMLSSDIETFTLHENPMLHREHNKGQRLTVSTAQWALPL